MCGYQSGLQDNWLITQFINNTMRLQNVFIRVNYAIDNQCTQQIGCHFTLDLYTLHTNEANQSFVRNVSVFGSQPVAVFTDTLRDGTNVTRIVKVLTDLSTSGFYLAFRDLGNCISIYQVTVYYPICDAISHDFRAQFEMSQLPGGTSIGMCLTNMAINLNNPNDPFEATCTLTMLSQNELFTNWTVSNGPSRCMCLPGYREVYRFDESLMPFYCEGKLVCLCMYVNYVF